MNPNNDSHMKPRGSIFPFGAQNVLRFKWIRGAISFAYRVTTAAVRMGALTSRATLRTAVHHRGGVLCVPRAERRSGAAGRRVCFWGSALLSCVRWCVGVVGVGMQVRTVGQKPVHHCIIVWTIQFSERRI